MQMWEKRIIAFLMTGGLLVIGSAGSAKSEGSAGPASAAAETETNVSLEMVDAETYEQYRARYEALPRPAAVVTVTPDMLSAQENSAVLENYLNRSGASVRTEEGGFSEYTVDVPEAGLYTLQVDFCMPEGRHTAAERNVLVNGTLPFAEAVNVTFKRLWKNKTGIQQDVGGNDIRPVQTENEEWQSRYLYDRQGFNNRPLAFYFEKGSNTLRLDAEREPMIVGEIRLCPESELPSYAELETEYTKKGYADANTKPLLLQGETADLKSDQTLAPGTDRSSPATSPVSASRIRLNIIGGESWSQTGQFITWRFYTAKAGLYTIALKWRQNIRRGMTSVRRMTIDGSVPCRELNQLDFRFNGKWQLETIGETQGGYRFYFAEGWHEITLEATLGDMGEVVRLAQDSLTELNRIYRRILMITGVSPDVNRDYNFDLLIPGEIQAMGEQAEVLDAICARMEELTGSRGANVSTITTLILQLRRFFEKPERIARGLGSYQDNLGALGAWLNSMANQALEIDFLQLQPRGTGLPRADANFFQVVRHEIGLFLNSFVVDYNTVADIKSGIQYINEEPVRIWVTSGRDQAQIIKRILDDTFTPGKGIRTKMELVQDNAILTATVAGRGPDVVLSTGDGTPVNYAQRGAVVDLTRFDDFDEVIGRFYDDWIPYKFNGGVYALPVTRGFPVMFYRKDILRDLKLSVPSDWNDVINMVSVLEKNGMYFVLPVSTPSNPGVGTAAFYMLLFQQGGQIYKEDGAASALDSETALSVFRQWTNFYVNYGLPVDYNFANRFRLGSTPVGIADISMYNTLMVFAPEIRGLWDFTLVPGTLREDGSIDRSVPSSGTACMILSKCTQPEMAWEVLKWWTSAETQNRFGQEMESLLGASARYATANKEAFGQLAWSTKERAVIEQQRTWAQGIPEVPGGYFTSRHIDNAFRRVTHYAMDPKDTLMDYVYVMNQEIAKKRKEFGLPFTNP